MAHRNGGSRRGIIVASCVAAATIVAAAFGACATGVSGDSDLSDSSADVRKSSSDVNHPPSADTGYHPADAGHSDLDTGIDPGGPDANDVDAFVPEDAGGDSSGSTSCGGLAEWFAGTTATHVKHLSEKYTCLVSGWCSDPASNSVAAYEPGKGWAWSQAWNDDGPCP